LVAFITAVIVVIAAGIRLIQHPVYSADSPRVRLTVAGGCPQSIGHAVDVSSPGPNRLSELFHYSRLARSGATGGLVCEYDSPQPTTNQGLPTAGPSDVTDVPNTTAVANLPPTLPSTLQSHVVLTRDQAAAVSLAAYTQSTLHPGGTFHCPAAAVGASSIIVVLSYPRGSDTDIWWNDTGCQNADNGHVEVYFYGVGLSGGDFTGAVEKVLPAAP
jgi:hypothetical protein